MKVFLCKIYNYSTGISGVGLCAIYFLIICAIHYCPQIFDPLLVYGSLSYLWQTITGHNFLISTFYEVWIAFCTLCNLLDILSPALILLLFLWARAPKQGSLKLQKYHAFVAWLAMLLGYVYIYHLAAPLTHLINERYDPVRYWLEGGLNEDPLSFHDVVGQQKRDAKEKTDLISAGSGVSDQLIKAAQNGPDQAILEQYKKSATRLYYEERFSNLLDVAQTQVQVQGTESQSHLKSDEGADTQAHQKSSDSKAFNNTPRSQLDLSQQDFIDETVGTDVRFYRSNAIHGLVLIGDNQAIVALKSLAQSNDKLMSADALLALRNIDPVFYATMRQKLHDDNLATQPIKP